MECHFLSWTQTNQDFFLSQKGWKSIFFKDLSLISPLTIYYSFISTPFWTIFFFTWLICMLSINHQNLVINETQYLDWSLQRLAIFKNKNKNSCVKRLVSWLSSCHDPCSIMLAWSQLVVVAKPWRCTTQQTC
jgi:hypothetical protein